MSLDIKLTDAIETAVEENGQPTAVGTKLIAWLRAINSGNENIGDTAQTKQRLIDLYGSAVVVRPRNLRGED